MSPGKIIASCVRTALWSIEAKTGEPVDNIRNILVIVDPTSSDQPAVQKAGTMASKLHASVELFACDTKASIELRSARQWASRGAAPSINLHDWLEGLAAPLRLKCIEVTTSAVQGDPLIKVILNWLKNSPADLVLKDTHHHNFTKRTFLGNTDWHLVRECPVPLLLTKPAKWREPLVVAAAIDPRIPAGQENFLDQRILDCAVAVGRPMHATIIAAHSYYPDIIAAACFCPQPNFSNVTAEMLDAEKTLRENALGSLLAPYQIAPQCVQVEMGIASSWLSEIAERHAVDIMVMGAISRSHLKQTLIGSTAERLLEYLPCDVLVVRETRFADSLPF
jgi:universal stress protein E